MTSSAVELSDKEKNKEKKNKNGCVTTWGQANVRSTFSSSDRIRDFDTSKPFEFNKMKK